jgi:hypothetical protein
MFSESLHFQNFEAGGEPHHLRALFRDDQTVLSLLRTTLTQLQTACQTDAGTDNPWITASFTLAGTYAVVLNSRRSKGGVWESAVAAFDISGFHTTGIELQYNRFFPDHSAFSKWACMDERFLKTMRGAALMCCLDSGAAFLCYTGAQRRHLAMSILADLFENAIPSQQYRFVSAVVGTGRVDMLPYTVRICASTTPPTKPLATGVLVDLGATPPTLEAHFGTLNFAQRTMQQLLGLLDLQTLRSTWNNAQRVVIETIGVQATEQSQDLTMWQMVRKSFPSSKFPVTEAEHTRLQEQIEKFHQTN